MAGSTGRILVVGATGGIGSRVVDLLQEAGAPLCALARRPEQVRAFEVRGVPARLGDLGDPESLRAAMREVETVFLLTAGGADQARHGRNAVVAAMRAGVRRVVHLSTQDADPRSRIPWAAAPAMTDDLLQQSGLAWTLLKPSAFMQNLLQNAVTIRRGFFFETSGAGVTGWIDSADIARVAARVLVEDGHDGREYAVTGPESLSAADIARRLSTGLGRQVRAVHLPAPLFRAVLRVSGLPPLIADGVVHQFVNVVRRGEGDARVMTDWVHRLTGRPPTTFVEFTREHRSAFLRV